MINPELLKKNIAVMRNEDNCGNVSDGDHTFEELYLHRAILTAALCNAHQEIAWKSKLHHDGAMYDGYFIVGMDTSFGQVTYHYSLEYWPLFNVSELERAPKWDGHSSEDAAQRLVLAFCASKWDGHSLDDTTVKRALAIFAPTIIGHAAE